MNAPDIPGFLDRRPLVWSYSLLHAFRDICPYQAQARYIDKTIQFVETPEIRWGNEVHAAFEARVGGGRPLPVEMQQWEGFARPFDGRKAQCETWFYIDDTGRACERFAKNKFGHGKIDLAIVEGENAYMADWKSGSGKYEDPFELEVNAVLLHAKYPHLKRIVGQYVWLKDNRMSKMYDLSGTAATWTEICRVMKQVSAWRQLGEFPKKQSGLCGWCQRWDCEKNTNQNRPS